MRFILGAGEHGDGRAIRIDAAEFGSSRASAGAVCLRRCTLCGLAWQSPLPAAEVLHRVYRELRDELYVAEFAGRRRALQQCLQLVSQYTNGPQGRILDVGCSTGMFLELAREAGWDVFGVEPSRWLSRRAQSQFGARVFNTTFEGAPIAAESFAAITMWDVLEHVPDPMAFVAKASHLLRPGGVLAVNVPNIESWIARLFGTRWPLLLPEHIYYFSPGSLRVLLERHGFHVECFHSHRVYFSAGYVTHRLAQHNLPGARALARVVQGSRLHSRMVPLLMGEMTVVARRDA